MFVKKPRNDREERGKNCACTCVCVYVYVYVLYACIQDKSLQSCPTLCDPIDSSPPGSSVPGILQARTLEWVAISFSNACCNHFCFTKAAENIQYISGIFWCHQGVWRY